MTSEILKYKLDELMTGSSIVFADDDDDDDDVDGSNCSVQSADGVIKTDVRRGILRNAVNSHQNHHVDRQPPVLPTTSSPGVPQHRVQSPLPHGGTGVFWPEWEAAKRSGYCREAASPPQTGNTPERRRTGNEACRAESCKEAHQTGSSAAAARKKLTVRFSPEADDACAAGSGQSTRTDRSIVFARWRPFAFPSETRSLGPAASPTRTERRSGSGQSARTPPSDESKSQVHVQPEARRLNVGRIAEKKFNDGRNSGCVAADAPKTSRKWYRHFSFRSNKNRDRNGVEEPEVRSSQPTYAEWRYVDAHVENRCRGRREMRETTTSASTCQLGDTDGGYARALAAQGYRQVSSPPPEPGAHDGGGQGRRAGPARTDWNRPVRSTSSAYDLRRSPTVADDDRKSRVAAAVRRSRSTVGDDRRRHTRHRAWTHGPYVDTRRRHAWTYCAEHGRAASNMDIRQRS